MILRLLIGAGGRGGSGLRLAQAGRLFDRRLPIDMPILL